MPAYPLYLTLRAVASFAMATAYTLVLVYQVSAAGLGPLQLVLVGTALEVVCFLAQVPTGVIADRYSRRRSVVIGYLLCGAGTVVFGLVPSFAAMLIGTSIWGVGITCVDGAEEAWAADELGDRRIGHALARGAQLDQLGRVLGILTCAGLGLLRLNLPILVGGGVWLALGVALALVMPERNFTRPVAAEPVRAAAALRRSARSMAAQVRVGAGLVRRRRALLCLAGATFFVGLGSEGIDRLGQPHLLTDLAFPATGSPVLWFAGLSIVGALASVALTEAVRRHIDTSAPRRLGRLLLATQAGCVLAVLAFALAPSVWPAVLAYLAIGVLRAPAGPVLTTWVVAQTESSSRATVLSMLAQVDAAGQIGGGPPVGLLGQRVSIRAALLGVAVLLAPAVALFDAARRSEPAAAAPGVPITGEPALGYSE